MAESTVCTDSRDGGPLVASDAPPSTIHTAIQPSDTFPVLLSRVLVAIALVAQIVVAWRYWSLTWDDSAITLGFARTFTLTGRIEPTPGSGIVEGYSTTLWMLLMAVAAKFATTPVALIAVAKISTLLLNLLNIVLIRRWFLTWNNEVCANLIAGSMGCGLMFYETINGMETPLILTLVMAMLLLFPISKTSGSGRFWYLLAGSAFVLVRWEAAWLLVPFVLIESRVRRAVVASATWLAVFVVSNVVRWRYFGSILPNTIIAKRGVPYSGPLSNHYMEPVLILASCKPLLLVLAAYIVYDRLVLKDPESPIGRMLRPLHGCWQLRFTVLFLVFSLVLSAGIGENLGPSFRSFYSGWPFLFFFLIQPVTSGLRSRALVWATAAICVLVLFRMSVRIREMNTAKGPAYMPGTTISDVALWATVLDDVESATHRQGLVFAGPDMGGLMLFSHGVRIVDLGLLCDPVLARERYAAVNSYVLQQRRPDVIEVHQRWTTLTDLHDLPLFRANYRPVYVDGERVFLSRALVASIDPARLSEGRFTAAGHPDAADHLPPSNAADGADDYVLNNDFGSYLVLR
jgi:hypothetical protein